VVFQIKQLLALSLRTRTNDNGCGSLEQQCKKGVSRASDSAVLVPITLI